MRKNGFTLVEAIIVVLVIVAILALLIPVLRERERQRLQAVADSWSREVFEFRAEPAKESFAEGEEIIVHCEIVNPTRYRLTLRKVLDDFHLVFADSNILVGFAHLPSPISQTELAPGDSVTFDVTLHPIGTGAAYVNIVYGTGIELWSTDPEAVPTEMDHIGFDSQGALEYRNLDLEHTIQVKGRSLTVHIPSTITLPNETNEFGNLRGTLSDYGKRFQSKAFRLVVNESEASQLPTFDDVVDVMEQLESSR